MGPFLPAQMPKRCQNCCNFVGARQRDEALPARASGPVVWAGRSGEDRELGFLRVALEKESRAVSNLAKFAIFCPRVAAWLGRR